MNEKIDQIKPYERIIYMVMIVALVIALISISTCSRKCKDQNDILSDRLKYVNEEFNTLVDTAKIKDATLQQRTDELISKKEEINKLIRENKISIDEGEKKIRALKLELNKVNEAIVVERNSNSENTNALNATISSLRNENYSLKNNVKSLQDDLARANSASSVVIEQVKNGPPTSISFLEPTWLSPSKGLYLKCKLAKPAVNDESFRVYVYDETETLVSPQNGIYSFRISRGDNDFAGQSSSYSKGTFKKGKKYSIAIKNSANEEIGRFPYRVPWL